MVDRDLARRILESLLDAGADFAEIFAQSFTSSGLAREGGKTAPVTAAHERGVGLRARGGDGMLFASVEGFGQDALLGAARDLAARLGTTRKADLAPFHALPRRALCPVEVDPASVGEEAKEGLLASCEEVVLTYDPRVQEYLGVYRESSTETLVANSEGLWAEDARTSVTLYGRATASEDGLSRAGARVLSCARGFEAFAGDGPADLARDAARIALLQLGASPMAQGSLPVVVAAKAGGVLIHEAVGHLLEGDAALRGTSPYAGKIGEVVASPKVTLVDDGTARHMRGTAGYDDEGEETRWVTLVEEGVLRAFLTDRLTSGALGLSRTGSARRESHRHPPLPRMRNTFLLSGEDNPASILASTEFGLLAVRLGASRVDQATGDFTFEVSEGYMIRDGKVAEPVRDALLVGNGPEVLRTVDRVGTDMGTSAGTCGKEDQAVPVGDGMPTVRIPSLEVRRGTA